jgi:uncharacterized peroxidase-related enzyme
MSRIPPVEHDHAPEPSKRLLDLVHRALGMIPNGVKVLASSPSAFEAWWAFERAINHGGLPRSVREQLAVMTANHNDCGYCLGAHSAAARGLGVTADDVEAARQGQASDAFAAAVLTFGAAVLANRDDVPDAALDAARRVGLRDTDLPDIVAVIAINTFSNYSNHLAHTELDFPAVELRRAD